MTELADTASPTDLVGISTADELREALGGFPGDRARDKERTRLVEIDRIWLSVSPFCLIATADAQGNCDISPKGDPPGFVHVIDDRTLAIPERPGNKRGDGYHNILTNPHVGLLSVVPGRSETLRINGRARLVRDAPFFDRMTVKGHRPILACIVDIDTIFFHCAKSFLRSDLWDQETWHPEALPSHAHIVKAVQDTPETLAELQAYYGPDYQKKLYG
ncbi:MAG TPA: pyridoxamine 5'-phosphate oxidase family protein [Actinocrinis sp.]|nr:pyridoxamine 5'-phosphate oxidase family protein [Actinocrinis sp.]